jgi:hypothetical protein
MTDWRDLLAEQVRGLEAKADCPDPTRGVNRWLFAGWAAQRAFAAEPKPNRPDARSVFSEQLSLICEWGHEWISRIAKSS